MIVHKVIVLKWYLNVISWIEMELHAIIGQNSILFTLLIPFLLFRFSEDDSKSSLLHSNYNNYLVITLVHKVGYL